ncbi:hypothetical protein BK816_05765 [Boudabousia tangfeifanii]|uniref:DNA 5'-3' helicase n=2 Tax=Boudabousia tangfeifanii TaxID=1912795 RepID=A0A1D9MM95_9ACTO|nr:hypothetical protein BK816_05765 [Boudabousia tangfeifanii]
MGGANRDGQEKMLTEVESAFQDDHNLLVQAGTGTGKSLGYLVPMIHACANGEKRGVISTATLALQRQIFNHDVPLVNQVFQEKMGYQADVALLKGWNNYVCQYKLSGTFSEADALFALTDAGQADSAAPSAMGEEILRVRQWAKTCKTGDRDELEPGVNDRIWRQVSLTRRECVGEDCPFWDQCFAQEARAKAAEADVVITNHAILGITATTDSQVLPDYDLLVVDEAHDLAGAVRNSATVEITGNALLQLHRQFERQGVEGVEDMSNVVDSLNQAMGQMEPGLIETGGPKNFGAALQVLSTMVSKAAKELNTKSREGGSAALNLVKNTAADMASVLEFATQDDPTVVRWISLDRDQIPHLYAAPLHVAGKLANRIWSEKTAVLTSATLQIGGTFENSAKASGIALAEKPWQGVDVGSPFDYRKQGILYVAEHLPQPGREGPSEQALAELVALAQASNGGVLGLYSSFKGAQRAAEIMREKTDLEVYCQGEDVIPTLVRKFASHGNACLFGTLSLWQGVDVPGSACRLVVIDRIPFPRPDDPMIRARNRAAEEKRQNAFMQVSIPHAALLLAQGVGRLLRRSDDRGMVAILDPRIRTRQYGTFLVRSLPDFWKTTDPQLARDALKRLSAV